VQPSPASPNAVRFGLFEADLSAGELRKRGRKIPLQDQPFRVLALLLLCPGELVTREELQRALWPADTFGDFDEGLNKAIQKLRQALDDSSDNPRFIETLPRKGYRFIASVDRTAEAKAAKAQPAPVDSHASASDSVIVANVTKRSQKAALVGSVAVVAVLVALVWLVRHRPPRSSAELTQKRLTFNSSENPIQSAAISPDGKYLAYSDQAGIHVKLLLTGEERIIPRPAGVPASAFWVLDSWFPDGTQLLADVYEQGGRNSMWTVSVLGQSPREIREGASGYEVSPDGTHIVFSPLGAGDTVREIWIMGSRGDNPQKVFAVGENEALNTLMHWSPDGQRLAFIRVQPGLGRPQRSIETCDLKGASRPVVVLDPDLGMEDLYWLPDGRIAYVSGDSFWQIGIDQAGMPSGKPKRIAKWAGSGLRYLSASADGKRLVLLKSTDQSQVYLGELAAGGTRMKPPRRLTDDEAFYSPTAWTPDSKAVLFDSDRNGTWGIFMQRISQETSEPVVAGLRSRLSADGAWILFFESPRTPANPVVLDRLMRIPASGGVPQLVLETRNFFGFSCARAPASLCVVLETSQDLKQLVITAFDPLKGRAKVLRTIELDSSYGYSTGLSPDGSTIAISRDREPETHIRLLSLSGGADREITVKGWPNIKSLDWAPDGKGLYCGSVSAEGGTLLYVDLKGNVRVLWQYKGANDDIGGVPSPDGRYLAIQRGVVNSNVWMVEGF